MTDTYKLINEGKDLEVSSTTKERINKNALLKKKKRLEQELINTRHLLSQFDE